MRNSIFQVFGNVIDFRTKYICRFPYDIVLVESDVSIFVQWNILHFLLVNGRCIFRLINGSESFDDVDSFLRSSKDVCDVLEQVVAHKSAPDDFLGANFPRNGKNFLCIQFDHFSGFIFANDREEIEQLADVFFSDRCISPAARSIGGQVIGELFKNGQRPGRVKVKHIRVFFSPEVRTIGEETRVLGPECCLHIQRWAL